MGNSGSTHNISYERSGIGHNSYIHTNFKRPTSALPQSQLSRCGSNPLNPLRSLNTDCRRSYSSPNDNKEAKFQTKTPFKVLPELDRRLHLKATTNGAILNSGGTISGRKLNEGPTQCIAIRNDRSGSDAFMEKQNMPSEFTRSQTLLNIKVKNKSAESNLSRMQRHTYSEPELVNNSNQKPVPTKDLPASRTSNRNKYLKKRRAPEIPPTATPTATLIKSTAPTGNQNTTDYSKPTHFAKNSDRSSKLCKPKATVEHSQSTTFNRAHVQRSSVNGNPSQGTTSGAQKPTYRREKSSDAIIFRSRKPEQAENCTKKEQHSDMQHRRTSGCTPAQKDNVEKGIIIPDQTSKTQRTFYFGQQLVAPSEILPCKAGQEEPPCDDAFQSAPTDDAEYKTLGRHRESVNDNGLMVHIRPTLPRRQVETPFFSPTLAWRSLLEELDCIDNKNVKNRYSLKEKATIERPIQPNQVMQVQKVVKSSAKLATWTPEQDLGEEIDERAKDLSTDGDSSSDEYWPKSNENELLFYGSKEKATSRESSAPVHTFSLSLPRDVHLQHARGMDTVNADDVCIYKSLQKPKASHLYDKDDRNPRSHARPDNAAFNSFEGCNNWMLHKSVAGAEPFTKSLEHEKNRQRIASIEPQSITFLTGGKHVMYLPGCNEKVQHGPSAEPKAEVQARHKPRHFKNRQRHIPQSLQDKTPIFAITSLNEPSLKLDDDKPFHQRFSFTNPVRLLEKKLHTDKSVRDSKIKMSLEEELEALKKVEEDFQRNRAYEKESLQQQLRLHFSAENDNQHNQQYHSLPAAPVLDQFSNINPDNKNDKLFRRGDPEGCVSTLPYSANESEDHNIAFAAKIY
ncbi:hypothetical protein KR222_009935 [Zaprionus bogoriensis]|nr:hypothetical protein KR222_009935 [Zaprionus bogoriensis]